MNKIKIKKGDLIKILIGKDKGKTGKVEKILLKKGKLLVANLNLYKKHLKPQGEKNPGGIVTIPLALPISKVAVVCPKCLKATRVGYQKNERICKKCQAKI